MAQDPEATIYIGNLDANASERVLYEVLVQAGPLVRVHIPTDRTTKRQCTYGFAEYVDKQSAHYAIKLFSGLVRLHNRLLAFNTSSSCPSASSQAHSNGQSQTKCHKSAAASSQQSLVTYEQQQLYFHPQQQQQQQQQPKQQQQQQQQQQQMTWWYASPAVYLPCEQPPLPQEPYPLDLPPPPPEEPFPEQPPLPSDPYPAADSSETA